MDRSNDKNALFTTGEPSSMKIHHLNTGTMCPMGRRLVNGTGSLFQRARMVCHCLLIETT